MNSLFYPWSFLSPKRTAVVRANPEDVVDVLRDLKSATTVKEEHNPSPEDLLKTAKWNILRRRFVSASWCYDEVDLREKYHSKLVRGVESQGESQRTNIILEAPAPTCENLANNP